MTWRRGCPGTGLGCCRILDPCCREFQDGKMGGWKSRRHDPILTLAKGTESLSLETPAAPLGMVSLFWSPPWVLVRPVKRPDYRDSLTCKSRLANLEEELRMYPFCTLKAKMHDTGKWCRRRRRSWSRSRQATTRPAFLQIAGFFAHPSTVWSEPSVTFGSFLPVLRLLKMHRRTRFPIVQIPDGWDRVVLAIRKVYQAGVGLSMNVENPAGFHFCLLVSEHHDETINQRKRKKESSYQCILALQNPLATMLPASTPNPRFIEIEKKRKSCLKTGSAIGPKRGPNPRPT